LSQYHYSKAVNLKIEDILTRLFRQEQYTILGRKRRAAVKNVKSRNFQPNDHARRDQMADLTKEQE